LVRSIKPGAAVTDLPPTDGLTVDPRSERFRIGRRDGFTDWWEIRHYWPKATDNEYSQGYAVGWEMASDPLHEDDYDPHLPPQRKPAGHR
jgi:hypothetical protein